MAKPNCEKCIHKAVCDNYEQWIGDITGFENIRAAKCPYFQESGWISVKERLPEQYKKVLVSNGEYRWVSSYLDSVGLFYELRPFTGQPTHWMPLPEPPKEG